MSHRTIGKLAKDAGVNVETIRFYERRGLIKRPPQPEQGWRQYDESQWWAVCYIRQAQKLGFSLKEIKKLRMNFEDRGTFCRGLHEALEVKLRQTDEEIQRLTQVKEDIQRTLMGCLRMSDHGECAVAARYETRTGMRVKKTPVRGA